MKKSKLCLLLFCSVFALSNLFAQYVQPERNDTVYLMPKVAFDSLQAKTMLARGTGTIKGVAYIRPNNNIGFNIRTGKKLLANKILVTLFPMTPYFEEYLSLKKKVNPKKLKFAFISNEAMRWRLEAITNSSGEFTFPEMKPGRYFLEGVLNWSQSGTYNRYTGSGYGSYGGQVDYYTRDNYRNNYSDYLSKIVEVKNDGEIVEVKLN
jgi:hypothetical protein